LFQEELEELGAIAAHSLAADRDWAAITRLCSRIGIAQLAPGDLVLAVEPREPRGDHMEFDSAICMAGVKRYLRPIMRSDQPGAPGYTPVDMKTFKPDPSIPVPDARLAGNFVLVVEQIPGVRWRMGVQLAVFSDPAN
jgi:hypothetical protein